MKTEGPFWITAESQGTSQQWKKIIPDDLAGDTEPRVLLARGDTDRLSFLAGLMEVSGWWGWILFIAFLGEREPEEPLPEDDADRDRLLWSTGSKTRKQSMSESSIDLCLPVKAPSAPPLPADGWTSMSISGARRGSSSWWAPSTRGHSPSGTLPSPRGVRPGTQEINTSRTQLQPQMSRQPMSELTSNGSAACDSGSENENESGGEVFPSDCPSPVPVTWVFPPFYFSPVRVPCPLAHSQPLPSPPRCHCSPDNAAPA